MTSPAADDPSLGISRTSPVSQPLSGLLHLPNELLQAIAAYLIPDPPSTTRFALRPVGSWELKEASIQWAEWKTCHRDLQSLTQACHHLKAVAGPCQYHTVVIHSGTSVVRLFRLLVERPEVKKWIHNLSCLVNLLDPRVMNDAKQEWLLQMGSGFRLPSDLTESGIAVHLFNFIVGYADNLADLLLAYPDESGPTLNESLEVLLLDQSARPRTKTPTYSPEAQLFPAKDALRHLTSLRLYCNRVEVGRDHTYTQMFLSHLVGLLPGLHDLKSLEVCCDNPSAWLPLQEPSYPKLPGIQTLRLYGSRIHEPELVALCRTCINLQTLLVHFEEAADDEADRERLPDGMTLNDALLGLAQTLESLELVALTEGHYLTRGDERPRKKENHRLSCFPELYQLRHLCTDYRGLFGTLGILEYDDGERLRHLLPASLRTFDMVCEFGTDKDFKPVYLANLDMMLHGVKLLCAAKSPKLTSISLALQTWPETSKYRTKFRRNINDVMDRCTKAGVKFRTYELLPRYLDEDELVAEGEVDADEEEGQQEAEVAAEAVAEEEEEDSDYYFSGDGGDDGDDFERDAQRPPSFEAFLQLLGSNHGHDPDELYYAYHEDRWDEYLF
ncbi:hypothetical protein CONLIGDRAFT_582932 [Coniochaeta ligniaria NRRL 30616]|uniref:Uncharacterized protein n=1 Tax=Coniochaeta ligniaria NRRL 30616 TaxID=1408157 RepID=A0A1J7ICK7_9PEZI|nr:hypothetical protein CONLIGDRAFT_582932 [Coniochaeta ligniaria NRRL 30616]